MIYGAEREFQISHEAENDANGVYKITIRCIWSELHVMCKNLKMTPIL